MKKFLSYILLTVMSLSLLTGCNTATRTTRDGRTVVVSPNGTRGNVRDTDGIIDGVDGDGRRTVYDGDRDGRTVYDNNGRVITRTDGRTRTDGNTIVDGNTRRAIDDITR